MHSNTGDVEPPTISNCPTNQAYIIPAGNQFMIIQWDAPSAADNSGQEPVVESNRNPGDAFRLGTTEVVYTFSDQSGNVAMCAFNITLSMDVVPPSIVGCPPDMDFTIPVEQMEDQVVTWTPPSASDDIDIVLSLFQSHESGDSFPEGRTRVYYNFTDSNNNLAVCTFLVTVEREQDIEPPTISNCPTDQAYIIPVGNQFMTVQWNAPSAVDNSGQEPIVTSTHNPDDAFPLGTTTVIYTFSDQSGNVAMCDFNITLSTPIVNPCQASPCRSNENCFYNGDQYYCVPGLFRKKREAGKLGVGVPITYAKLPIVFL
jgi:hypothetical protein